MKRLPVFSAAVALLMVSRASSEDSFGRILEHVYLPETRPTDRGRIAPPAAREGMHVVSESELLARLEAELAQRFNADGELRLSFGRPWQPIRIPSDAWQITMPELPLGGLSKSFLIRVRINAGERAWFDQQMVVQAQLWKPVLVATRRLERGQSLESSAADVQTRDVLRERVAPLPATTVLNEQEVLQTVPEGRPLTGKDIGLAPMVRKGALVEVRAGDGTLSISMKGQAMGTGGMGEAITIRNLDTRKDFQARIVSRNSVRVTF